MTSRDSHSREAVLAAHLEDLDGEPLAKIDYLVGRCEELIEDVATRERDAWRDSARIEQLKRVLRTLTDAY